MSKLDIPRARRIKAATGELAALKGAGFVWYRDPLTPFYGVGAGKVAIHLSADSVTLDGSGNVQTIINKGGAGAMFNAARVGDPIPITTRALDFTGPSTGYFETPTIADLNGTRLMYVFNLKNFETASRWLGSNGFEFRSTTNALGWTLQIWSNLGGSGGAGNIITIRQPNTDKFVLIENEFKGDGRVTTWIDGAQIGNTPVPATVGTGNIPLSFIGKGNGSGRFNGLLGDVLGVTLGAGSDAAIITARKHLAIKYGISAS